MRITHTVGDAIVNLTVKRRYLTEREVERLMDCARKHGRYGHRDATMILVAYRHGLRASEVCDLQWQQIELSEGRLHVHRVKNGISSVHPIRGDEMRALRKLRRDYPRDAHVFVSERGGPISSIGFHRLIQRLGEAAKMPTMATTRGPSSTTWATKTFSTPSGTPNWRPTDSKTFGGTDAPARAGTPLRQTLHGGIIVRSRARRRWHTLLRLALLRPDRGVSLHHQPVRLALYGL